MLAQGILKLFQIGGEERCDISIDRRCRRPFVLFHGRDDLARNGDVYTGRFFLDDFAHALFVAAVLERPQEANAVRLDAFVPQLAHRLPGAVLVQWDYDGSLIVDAFVDLFDPPLRYDGGRLFAIGVLL